MFRLRWKIRCTIDQLNLLIIRTAIICRHIIIVIQIVACGHRICIRFIVVACVIGTNAARCRRIIDQFVRNIIVTAVDAICNCIDWCGLENSICWMLECYGATRSIQTPISGHRDFTSPRKESKFFIHSNALVLSVCLGIFAKTFLSLCKPLITHTRVYTTPLTEDTFVSNRTKPNTVFKKIRKLITMRFTALLLLFISRNRRITLQPQMHTIPIHNALVLF